MTSKTTKKVGEVQLGTPANERKEIERQRLYNAGGKTISIKLKKEEFETLNKIITSTGETKQMAISRLIVEEGKKLVGRLSKK